MNRTVQKTYVAQLEKHRDVTVRCWESAEEAAKTLKVPTHQLKSAIDGRKKSTLGYRW